MKHAATRQDLRQLGYARQREQLVRMGEYGQEKFVMAVEGDRRRLRRPAPRQIPRSGQVSQRLEHAARQFRRAHFADIEAVGAGQLDDDVLELVIGAIRDQIRAAPQRHDEYVAAAATVQHSLSVDAVFRFRSHHVDRRPFESDANVTRFPRRFDADFYPSEDRRFAFTLKRMFRDSSLQPVGAPMSRPTPMFADTWSIWSVRPCGAATQWKYVRRRGFSGCSRNTKPWGPYRRMDEAALRAAAAAGERPTRNPRPGALGRE